MIAVDASAWTSLLLPSDVHHLVTQRWLQDWLRVDGKVVAPVLLLAEVAAAVARRSGRSRLGARAIDEILHQPALRLVPLDPPLAEEAARLAADRRLRGADAVYVAVARRFGVPLVTWDREQRERAAGIIEVREPAWPIPEGESC